jgi:hypothetical protein
MRSILIIVAFALPVAAQEPLRPVLEKLRSEDPAERREAKDLMLLDPGADLADVRAFAAGEVDAEARAAANEIAEILEYRVHRVELLAAAENVLEGKLEKFESQGPASLNDLRRILKQPDYLAADYEETRLFPSVTAFGWDGDVGRFPEDDAGSRMASLTCAALAALTLADCGDGVSGWLEFVDRHSGAAWREIRLDGLASRGYRVRSRDANEAASELLRAWIHVRASARVDGALSDPAIRCSFDVFRRFAADLLDVEIRRLGSADPIEAVSIGLETWVGLNSGHFEWLEGRLHSKASPQDYAESLENADPCIRVAALRVLEEWPGEIPEQAWELLADDAALVLRIMSAADRQVPPAAVPKALAAAGEAFDNPEYSGIWDVDSLKSIIEDPDSDLATRGFALDWLLLRCERPYFSITAREAGGGDKYSYDNPRAARYSASTLARQPAVSILIDACLGDESELNRVETWLQAAGPMEKFLDIAFALARRGRREGLRLICLRAYLTLPPSLRDLVRDTVDGAPEGDDALAWQNWGWRDADPYEWNPARQKWELEP